MSDKLILTTYKFYFRNLMGNCMIRNYLVCYYSLTLIRKFRHKPIYKNSQSQSLYAHILFNNYYSS